MEYQTPEKHSLLVKVSIRSIRPWGGLTSTGELIHAVVITGESSLPDVCFNETVYAAAETLDSARRLEAHGSVVIGLSERWRYEHDSAGGWLEHVLAQATSEMRRIKEQQVNPDHRSAGYDQDLAHAVLFLLNAVYPAAIASEVDLKYNLANEPSDRTLLTALDALLGDDLISGKPIRNQSGDGSLATVANIQITRNGRLHLTSREKVEPQSIIHGDQIINYGHAGAVGRESTGISHHHSGGEALFRDLTSKMRVALKDDPALPIVLQRLGEIEAATNQKTALERYSQLVGLLADHVGVAVAINPYVASISHWITTLAW